MRQARRHLTTARDERGITMILVAVIMVALLMMVAVVVDVAMIRSDRRSNKSIADFAVTAGVNELGQDPWAAVCTAYNYLKDQGAAPATTPTATNGASTPIAFATACNGALKAKCTATNTTWARLRAVSADGLVTVDIQSPYDAANDSQFVADESKIGGDAGVPCDQVGVKISETRTPSFARVMGIGPQTSLIRSVARRAPGELREPAALILLERHDCNTLQTGGAGTKVIAQPLADKPGIIQIDSDATGSCTSQAIINGQSTSSGPSIMACSSAQILYGCKPSLTANRESIVGVYAASANPGGNIAPAFSVGTYGDTPYQEALQFTRGPVDDRHGSFVRSLDTRVQAVFAGAALSNPPGCSTPVAGYCSDGSKTWLVISGAACDPTTATGLATIDLNVWFNCSSGPGKYTINAPLTLPLAQNVVFNNGGLVDLSSTLSIPHARTVYVRGDAAIGFQVSGGGSLILNNAGAAECKDAAPTDSNVFVIFQGTYDGRGGSIRTCETFVYLASGGDKVPATSGTAPCPSVDNSLACGSYKGNINMTAGVTVDWTAPDESDVPFCRPDLLTGCYDKADPSLAFEDLAFWTEAATGNVITGGGSTKLGGIFFLPNADTFDLAGGGSLPIELNAQFIIRKLKVTGGATVTLIPDAKNSFTVRIPANVLVR